MSNPIRFPELTDLPPRAILAFAARCAQRVLPLAGFTDLSATPLATNLRRAIDIAEQVCGTQDVRPLDLHKMAAALPTSGHAHTRDSLAIAASELLRCAVHLAEALQNSYSLEAAANSAADAVADAKDHVNDPETAKFTQDPRSVYLSELEAQTALEIEQATEAAGGVFDCCSTAVLQGAESRPDLAAMAQQGHNLFIAAAWEDVAKLRSKAAQVGDRRYTILPGTLGPLWPEGAPEWAEVQEPLEGETGPPAVAIVWDPQFVTEDEYAELVAALGDLVRIEGGLGIERVRSRGIGIACAVEAQP